MSGMTVLQTATACFTEFSGLSHPLLYICERFRRSRKWLQSALHLIGFIPGLLLLSLNVVSTYETEKLKYNLGILTSQPSFAFAAVSH